ncbi:MAG: hypothetical protein ACW96X_02410 [Promethearchaeota archaeon]
MESNPFLQSEKEHISSENYLNLELSGQEISIITPENITYFKPMSGHYPGTWSFHNDQDGTIPQGWVDNSQAGCTARVVSEKVGHTKVVHLDDDSGNKIYFDNFFPSQTYGTVEFWVLTEDASYGFNARTHNSTSHMWYIAIGSDKWVYVDSNDTVVNIPTFDGVYDPVDNTWYHVSVHFRCDGAPSFMGLNENKYRIVIDGLESGELEAKTNTTFVENLDFATGAVASTDGWVDAVGFSWNTDYYIGDNLDEGLLLSYYNSTNLDWKGYSLDGQTNKTIMGNTTIPMPQEGIHTIQIFGNSSIGEIYESDISYFTVKSINIISPENRTYSEPLSGYFPATYGFENDEPTDWAVTTPASTSVGVIENMASHKNVVELSDLSGSDYCQIVNNISDQVNGTLEFWYRKTSTTDASYIVIGDGDTLNSLFIRVHENGLFRYYTTVYNDIQAYSANSWYHIKIEFDCADQWYIWINDVKYGPYGYRGTPIAMDRVQFQTSSSDVGFQVYVDAVGYSWDPNYNVGDNLDEGLLLSYENSNNLEWKGYSLDGQTNKTILGNTTIPMPSLGHHTIQVFGNSSLGFYYESEVRHFTVIEDISISILTPTNTTYSEPMRGYYPATYGFENDEDETIPEGWEYRLTIPQGDSSINVISTLDGHEKVLDLNKGNTYGSHLIMSQNFSAQEYGTIEFWLRTTDVTEKTEIILRNESGSFCAISISQGAGSTFTIYASGGWQSLSYPATNNKWYHIKLQFECGTGNHYGLDQYYFRAFIDGLEFGDYNFAANAIYLDTFVIVQPWDTDNYHSYFDAIGYSWNSNYNIGDNLNEGLLLSFTNSSPLEWIGYSLDDQANKTIIGNMVVPMPENGDHSLQIHGRSSAGYYYKSDLCYFSVHINQPAPSPIGTQYLVYVLIGVFSLLGIAIVVIVYRMVHNPSERVKTRKPKLKKTKTRKKIIKEEDLFCPFCNTPITTGQRFCTYCSSKLVEEEDLE